jgi:hypothetical protein
LKRNSGAEKSNLWLEKQKQTVVPESQFPSNQYVNHTGDNEVVCCGSWYLQKITLSE